MHTMIQCQITPNLPVTLLLCTNGTIVMQKNQSFFTCLDIGKGVKASFFQDGWSIHKDGEDDLVDYPYGAYIDYKDEPLLKKWLKEQNMVLPSVRESFFSF